jgi:hypothetical protein
MTTRVAPRVINVDQNAAYIGAVRDLKQAGLLPKDCEVMHMIRKGQIEGIEKGNIQAQNQFIDGLFGLVA